MRMLYEGQTDGKRLRVPVQFARWPDEPADPEIRSMYEQLFSALKNSAVGRGEWKMLRHDGSQNTFVIQWQNSPECFDLVVVNLAAMPARCRVRPEISGLGTCAWDVRNVLAGPATTEGSWKLQAGELALELPAHAARLLRINRKS